MKIFDDLYDEYEDELDEIESMDYSEGYELLAMLERDIDSLENLLEKPAIFYEDYTGGYLN